MGTGGGLVVIDFSEQGNSAHFRRGGWSGQERDRVWAVGPRSVLQVPLQSSGRSVVLEAEIGPNLALPVITGQIVRVRANGTAIGGVRISERSMIRCELEPAIIGPNGMLEIEFEFPGFFRQDWLNGAGDDRPLSGWFSFIRLYTLDLFRPGPHFPPSAKEFPVIGLEPPLPGRPDGLSNGEVGTQGSVYTFGPAGTCAPFLRDGWDDGEDDFTWTVASSSRIELPAPDAPGPYVLRLDAAPLIVPGKVKEQPVTMVMDGIVVGQIKLQEPAASAMPLPRELTEGRDGLLLDLIMPNAMRPGDLGPSNDKRLLGIAVTQIHVSSVPPCLPRVEIIRAELGFHSIPIAISDRFVAEDAAALPAAIEAALGLDAASLARGFESLGITSEFGVVQRKLGVDAINLFRFCDGILADLVRALTDDLAFMESPAFCTLDPSDNRERSQMIAWPAYNLRWPGMAADDATISRTFRYLRRKFFEGISAGRKVYVLQPPQPIQMAQLAALLMGLMRHGRASLLCVEPAPRGRRPGEVQLLMPGVMLGYLERSAPKDNPDGAEPADWLRVMANAALLQRDSQALAAA